MAARSEAIANIQAELDTPVQTSGADATVIQPRPAANVDAPTPLTKADEKKKKQEEKEAKEAQKEAEKEAEKAEKARTEEEKRLADAETARIQQEEKVEGLASATLRQAGNIWRNTKVRIGEIPTPGSILLPLVILLLGFFILIPVNGHSRFVWLWLALSGNAKIGLKTFPDTVGGPGEGQTGQPTGQTTGESTVELPPGGSNLLLPFPTNILSFSGVQDIS